MEAGRAISTQILLEWGQSVIKYFRSNGPIGQNCMGFVVDLRILNHSLRSGIFTLGQYIYTLEEGLGGSFIIQVLGCGVHKFLYHALMWWKDICRVGSIYGSKLWVVMRRYGYFKNYIYSV